METKKEEFVVEGKEVIKLVKKIVKEGNARKIIIKNEKNKTVLVVPLTILAIGTVLVPVLAAIGAIAAILTKCKVVVEKEVSSKTKKASPKKK